MKYQIPLSPHPPLHVGPAPDEAEIRATAKSIQENQQQEVMYFSPSTSPSTKPHPPVEKSSLSYLTYLPGTSSRTTIFQQARANISRSSPSNPAIITATPTGEPTRTSSTIERHLYSRYPNKNNNNNNNNINNNNNNNNNNKDGGAPSTSLDPHSKPPEPDPIYSPKDLSDFIANGTKQDAAYHIFEAVRGCQTKLKNASAREKEFMVVGGGGGGGVRIEDSDVRMSAPVGPRREVEGLLEEQKRVQRNTLDVARDPRLQRR